jgi:glucans biosynthesis protein
LTQAERRPRQHPRRSPIHRRDLLRGAVALTTLLLADLAADAVAADREPGFDGAVVRKLAQELAQKPYEPPDSKLPDELAKLNYDQYRSIRFDPRRALWKGSGRKFTVEFFHRGFLYKDRVEIFVVENGRATRLGYLPDDFIFGLIPRPKPADLGFAGFRLHAPINRLDYDDEICAFVGASYFRSLAKGQGYGLSARGLAIKTADPSGEEFPLFKSFWIEVPPPGVDSIAVHALLDSPSVAGAYRFTIRPGQETVFDTECTLYPRVDIDKVGIAPLTSMFYFDANARAGIDDWRPAAHDSEGLWLWTGRNEQIWRPLVNPPELQISAFADVNPRGFGLLQRKRAFADYQDLEARYEKRPSLWVEPVGDWGEGGVNLVEIPSREEIHDNIVAFWRPAKPLQAKQEYRFDYRLHWCWSVPRKPDLARVASSRAGVGFDADTRLFVVDFVGDNLKALPEGTDLKAKVGASKGKIQHVVAQPNPETGGWRVSFELAPGGEKLIELQLQLLADKPVAESWLYRWQA